MKIIFRDNQEFKKKMESVLKELMVKYDKAKTHKKYYALFDTLGFLDDHIKEVIWEVSIDKEDPIINYLVNHPFSSLSIRWFDVTKERAHVIPNELKENVSYWDNELMLTFQANGSGKSIYIQYNFDTLSWDLDEKQFSRRRDPQKFIDFFKGLTELIEVDYKKR